MRALLALGSLLLIAAAPFSAQLPAPLLAQLPDESVKSPLVFTPAQVELGKLSQGDQKHFKVKVTNSGKQPLNFLDAIAQGRGPQQIAWPKSLAAGASATLEFDYNSHQLSGKIHENITLVSEGEVTHSLLLQGIVEAPIEVWPAIVDFGYFGAEPVQQVLYVYSTLKPEFALEFDGAQMGGLFSVKIEKAKLDLGELPDIVREGGTKAGYKVTLTLDPKRWDPARKSLGAIAGFRSPLYPKASPDFYAVGYRKE